MKLFVKYQLGMNFVYSTNNYISSIEGTVLSNFLNITVSTKTRKWVKKLSQKYFDLELSLFQFLCISNVMFLFNIFLIYLVSVYIIPVQLD